MMTSTLSLRAVLTFLGVICGGLSASWAQESLVESRTVEPFEVKATVLGVNAPDSQRFPQTRTADVSFRLKEFAPYLAGGGLNWNVKEALSTFELHERLPAKGTRRLRVRPEGDSEADVWVRFPSGRITADTENLLTFEIRRPERVGAGAFTGDLIIRFSNENVIPPAGFQLKFPVHVVGFGRVIEEVAFLETPQRVGAPASVRVQILTIGSDLGHGAFRLMHRTPENLSQLAARLTLPMSTPEPVIPRYDEHFGEFADVVSDTEPLEVETVDSDAEKSTAEWATHTEWRDAPLWQRPLKSRPIDGQEWQGVAALQGVVERHVMDVQLPDSFAIGRWEAEVDWEQTPYGSTPRPDLQQQWECDIIPGLRVSQRTLWKGGNLAVELVSPVKFATEPDVQVTFPSGGKTATISLKQKSATESGPVPRYRYLLTNVGLEQLGTYTLQVLNPPEGAPASMKEPVHVHVCFEVNDDELRAFPQMPLFASPTPYDVWIQAWMDAQSSQRGRFGGKEKHHRVRAISFRNATQEMKAGSIVVRPVYQLDDCQKRSTARRVSLPIAIRALPTSPAALDASSPPATRLELPKDEWKHLDIEAQLSSGEKLPLGQYCFEQRLQYIGQDADGNFYTCIKPVKLSVVLDHEWEHNKWVFLAMGGVGGLVVMGTGGWFLARQQKNRRALLSSGESGGGISGDFLDMAQSPRPTTTSASSSPVADAGAGGWWGKKPAASAPKPPSETPSEEPPPAAPSGGDTNWFDS